MVCIVSSPQQYNSTKKGDVPHCTVEPAAERVSYGVPHTLTTPRPIPPSTHPPGSVSLAPDIQVRMQLGAGGGSPVAAAKLVYNEAGIRGMYAGLSAAITRQCVYTTLRVGLYDWIRVREKPVTGRGTTDAAA